MDPENRPTRDHRSWPKIPARYTHLVMPLLLSFFMTFLVSLISTVRSLGLVDGLFQVWMGAWLLSWMVAFPALLLVQPLVRRIMGLIVEKP
ncbi:MAG: DUF2798 domain-containing protein [Rhodoferax sp.]|nr:DUF2798 domain-containing protein [Rhodoferax sp.]